MGKVREKKKTHQTLWDPAKAVLRRKIDVKMPILEKKKLLKSIT